MHVHVCLCAGEKGLTTKPSEATFLFTAMIEELLGPAQTIGSTFEQPMERSHNLGKQKVSRRAVCAGGHKDPHKCRVSGLRRTMVETAIQKKRKRSTKEEVDLALINAKRIKKDPDAKIEVVEEKEQESPDVDSTTSEESSPIDFAQEEEVFIMFLHCMRAHTRMHTCNHTGATGRR